ncbi:MAG TPA: hypothetical protein VH062_13465 [Polyangiaceae bacterium]|nr:hypothetical protein [Polyangiaceae bacterium]
MRRLRRAEPSSVGGRVLRDLVRDTLHLGTIVVGVIDDEPEGARTVVIIVSLYVQHQELGEDARRGSLAACWFARRPNLERARNVRGELAENEERAIDQRELGDERIARCIASQRRRPPERSVPVDDGHGFGATVHAPVGGAFGQQLVEPVQQHPAFTRDRHAVVKRVRDPFDDVEGRPLFCVERLTLGLSEAR